MRRSQRLAGWLLRTRQGNDAAVVTTTAASPAVTRTVVLASALAGAMVSGLLVWGASDAAFSAITTNPTNSWTAGTVAISDDDSNGTIVNLTGLLPGDNGQKCITVSYTGNAPAAVRLYVSAATGTLAPYITFTAEQGSGGSWASCTGFTPTVSSGATTLAAFRTAHSSHATGFGNWNPPGVQARTYRITWSFAGDTDALNDSTGMSLTWEAQG